MQIGADDGNGRIRVLSRDPEVVGDFPRADVADAKRTRRSIVVLNLDSVGRQRGFQQSTVQRNFIDFLYHVIERFRRRKIDDHRLGSARKLHSTFADTKTLIEVRQAGARRQRRIEVDTTGDTAETTPRAR